MDFLKYSDRVRILDKDDATDRPCLGYIKGSRHAMMIDAGTSPRHVALFMEALAVEDLPRPDFAGITHWHWDHSFGMCALDATTIATELTNTRLKEMGRYEWTDEAMRQRLLNGEEIKFCDINLRLEYAGALGSISVVPADIVFTDKLVVDLGDITCECYHTGGPHSEDSAAFFVPEEKLLFIGDGAGKDLYGLDWDYDPEHPEQLGEILGALPFDPEKLRPYVAFLQSIPFTHCVLGHAGVLTREELLSDLLPYV